MALTLQALGLEAKDQGVSESAWIVQIAGTIIFQKIIHSWKTPIMRSVQGERKTKVTQAIHPSFPNHQFQEFCLRGKLCLHTSHNGYFPQMN